MSQVLPGDALLVHDLIGIGFGPSNVAMAIALSEHNARVGGREAITAQFFEQQPRFGWHRGMLIDDATMQVSFLKDLVTLRNPASEFSFLCYLKSKGRLIDFINHKNLFPLRVEFHDYFEWAAAKVEDMVSYGHEVVGIVPVVRDGAVEYVDVTVRSGEGLAVHRARNLVIGTGLRPLMPEGVERGHRVWHTSELLAKADELEGTSPSRFIVVGAGQSAAENVAYLHRRFPGAEVCAVFSRYGYSPADDSGFANRIFDPGAVDEYFAAPENVKRRLMDYHGNTNYSVVDIDLIDDLYRQMYQEKVLGVERLRFLNVSRLADVKETPTQVRATVKSLVTGEETLLDADVVVFATGYSPADPWASSAKSPTAASGTTRAASVSSVTTASRRTPGCAAASICKAARSTRTASPRPCCPTPRSGSARSWTRSSTGASHPRPRRPGRLPTASAAPPGRDDVLRHGHDCD
ncbi:lysine/ornithine N-monooxygenase [Streptomyces violaceusniger]|uniref:L-lysine N6-monooxygenase MbtG n=1 Tax=Streptomyces violaceusniger TaxID=68280 RepID=A0A4D4LNG0_STRVO|nr:lysine/ornithine N-monooxygenase [Streptomyces violaceusniger]